MSVEIVKKYFADNNIDKEILEFPVLPLSRQLAYPLSSQPPSF